MGLFGLREDKIPADMQRERLHQARKAYDDRRKAFCDAGDTLEMVCQQGQDWLHMSRLRLRIDADAFVVFPEVNTYDLTDAAQLDQMSEIRLPRTVYRMTHTSPARQPVREQGEHLFFDWPDFTITLDGPQTATLRVTELRRACRFFPNHADVLAVRTVFDLWDGPVYSVVFARQNTATSDPTGRYDMWREGDTLYFYQQPGLYMRKPEFLEVWHWPLAGISYFQTQGQLSYEYITSGGDVEFDPGAAWRMHLTHVDFLEDAISVTPVRTRKVEHDDRSVKLVLQDGRVLELSYDSLDSLRALIPEKAFEKLAIQPAPAPDMNGREPTPVEQLKILADLVDRGYLSREEYDAAKPRLLGKL